MHGESFASCLASHDRKFNVFLGWVGGGGGGGGGVPCKWDLSDCVVVVFIALHTFTAVLMTLSRCQGCRDIRNSNRFFFHRIFFEQILTLERCLHSYSIGMMMFKMIIVIRHNFFCSECFS